MAIVCLDSPQSPREGARLGNESIQSAKVPLNVIWQLTAHPIGN